MWIFEICGADSGPAQQALDQFGRHIQLPQRHTKVLRRHDKRFARIIDHGGYCHVFGVNGTGNKRLVSLQKNTGRNQSRKNGPECSPATIQTLEKRERKIPRVADNAIEQLQAFRPRFVYDAIRTNSEAGLLFCEMCAPHRTPAKNSRQRAVSSLASARLLLSTQGRSR